MSNNNWIAIGLALGIGLAIVFILHNISVSLQIRNQSSPMETPVSFVYDDQNCLKSLNPVKLKPIE